MYTDFWIKFLQYERRIHLHDTLIEMAIISALMYFGSGISGIAAINVPTAKGMDVELIAATSSLAIIFGTSFYLFRKQFPLWFAVSHIFFGIPLVALTIWAGHVPSAAQISIVYIMCSIYSFHFLNVFAGILVILLAGASFAFVGYSHQWDGWQSMVVLFFGCSFTVGFIVNYMVKRIHGLATIDSLTGLFNRHTWDTLFEQELAYTIRIKNPLSLMVIDLNKFKQINDTQGHLAGDNILQKTAKAIKNVMRDSDIIARWGGDEFVILLRNCTLEQAHIMEQRLHKQLEGIIGASIGLTDYQPNDTADKMLGRADKDMYANKQASGG